MLRLAGHLRSNVVAYLALFFALGAGGGYAIAATTSPSIHGCVVSRTGELLVRGRCGRGERSVRLAQAQGNFSPLAVGEVSTQGRVTFQSGLRIKQMAAGAFLVSVRARGCTGARAEDVPTVSPVVNTGPGVPVVYTTPRPRGTSEFVVSAGQLEAGGFVPGSQGFNVAVVCRD